MHYENNAGVALSPSGSHFTITTTGAANVGTATKLYTGNKLVTVPWTSCCLSSSDTANNRSVLGRHREATRSLLPLDGRDVLRAFASGHLPDGNGIARAGRAAVA